MKCQRWNEAWNPVAYPPDGSTENLPSTKLDAVVVGCVQFTCCLIEFNHLQQRDETLPREHIAFHHDSIQCIPLGHISRSKQGMQNAPSTLNIFKNWREDVPNSFIQSVQLSHHLV